MIDRVVTLLGDLVVGLGERGHQVGHKDHPAVVFKVIILIPTKPGCRICKVNHLQINHRHHLRVSSSQINHLRVSNDTMALCPNKLKIFFKI